MRWTKSELEEVNRAIALMDQVTSHNAALVEDAGKAAKMLEQQAQLLALSVGRFQLEAAYANGSDSENDAYPALTRPSALP